MKINDAIFRYDTTGFTCRVGICRVRTFLNSRGDLYVLLSELDENTSTSVTNAIETILQQLRFQEKIPPQIQVMEHYPRSTGFAETFDLVTFSPQGVPSWKGISRREALQLLECPEEEFQDYRSNPRVQQEIQEALDGMGSIRPRRFAEDPLVTERRLEIEASMHSMDTVRAFFTGNPKERDIATFLREDLSLVAENYAMPPEEYIVFSEFPVGPGRVDFAVFSGRSRMSVYLIEIKGAEQGLCKKNHYRSLRAKPQEVQEQLIQRMRWCESHGEEFRRYVHRVLRAVLEEEKRPYHAFLGPKSRLQVDPDKEIQLHYIAISNRTEDDLLDSQKRHAISSGSKYALQFETWDSWMNKLTRA